MIRLNPPYFIQASIHQVTFKQVDTLIEINYLINLGVSTELFGAWCSTIFHLGITLSLISMRVSVLISQ